MGERAEGKMGREFYTYKVVSWKRIIMIIKINNYFFVEFKDMWILVQNPEETEMHA